MVGSTRASLVWWPTEIRHCRGDTGKGFTHTLARKKSTWWDTNLCPTTIFQPNGILYNKNWVSHFVRARSVAFSSSETQKTASTMLLQRSFAAALWVSILVVLISKWDGERLHFKIVTLSSNWNFLSRFVVRAVQWASFCSNLSRSNNKEISYSLFGIKLLKSWQDNRLEISFHWYSFTSWRHSYILGICG